MASVSASYLGFKTMLLRSNKTGQAVQRNGSNLLSVYWGKNSSKASCFRVSCAAKPETLSKVSDIVRKQLALAAEVPLTPATKFSDLGADSLDSVEIVMTLEEEFEINVEEENNLNITTVQDAADMVEKLIEKKAEATAS